MNLGAKDNADPRWLLPLICRRGGVTRREVGSIRIGPRDTMFEIAAHAADDFAASAAEPDPRARHVHFDRTYRADRPDRSDRADRPDRPDHVARPDRAPRPTHPPRHAKPPHASGGHRPPKRRGPPR